jgi:hypothetical protein
MERGYWGCAFDAILFFLAFATFSYLFSFGMALAFELPISSIYMEFFYVKPTNVEDAFFNKSAINDEVR